MDRRDVLLDRLRARHVVDPRACADGSVDRRVRRRRRPAVIDATRYLAPDAHRPGRPPRRPARAGAGPPARSPPTAPRSTRSPRRSPPRSTRSTARRSARPAPLRHRPPRRRGPPCGSRPTRARPLDRRRAPTIALAQSPRCAAAPSTAPTSRSSPGSAPTSAPRSARRPTRRSSSSRRRPARERLGRLPRRGDDEPRALPARLPGLRTGDDHDGRDARRAHQPHRAGGV